MGENPQQARLSDMSRAEIEFNRLDINGDGRVDKNEVRQLLWGHLGGSNLFDKEAKIEQFFKRADLNGDGKIDKAEWLEFYSQNFDTENEKDYFSRSSMRITPTES